MTTATYTIEAMDLDQIAALDLQDVLTREGHAGYAAARAYGIGDDGYRNGLMLTVLYHADAGRAGVCSNGDSQWTDCGSIEDAVERYLGIDGKEMSN